MAANAREHGTPVRVIWPYGAERAWQQDEMIMSSANEPPTSGCSGLPACLCSDPYSPSERKPLCGLKWLATGLPTDWAATIWLMHGCGLRIGEALAVNLRCRIDRGKTLRVKEQVNLVGELRPLKFRKIG